MDFFQAGVVFFWEYGISGLLSNSILYKLAVRSVVILVSTPINASYLIPTPPPTTPTFLRDAKQPGENMPIQRIKHNPTKQKQTKQQLCLQELVVTKPQILSSRQPAPNPLAQTSLFLSIPP